MANRSLGTLTLDMVLKVGGFSAGMDKAARDADKRLSEIERRAYKFGQAIGQAMKVGAIALAAGAGLVVNQLRQSINQMDELSKAAQRVSLPTEQFSALVYAGKLADVEIGALQTNLGRLTKAQADSLKSTSQQAKVFSALGISAKDAEGNLRSSYDVLLDFADAFKRQEGSPEIVAAGIKIFGRGFQELIPLLKDGADGIRSAGEEAAIFGQVISTEAGQQAEAFNDNLARLKSLASGLSNALAAELLPDLKRITDQFVVSAKEGASLAETARSIADFLRVMAGAVEFAMGPLRQIDNVIQGTVIGLQGLSEAARGVIGLDWSQITRGLRLSADAANLAITGDPLENEKGARPRQQVNIIDPAELMAEDRRRVEAMRQARAEAERLRKLAFGDEEKPKPPKKPGSQGKSEEEKEAERLQQEYQRLIESLKERTALIGQEGEAAKLSYDLQFGSLKNLTQAEKDRALVAAEKYDADLKAFRTAEDLRREEERGIENATRIREDYEFEIQLLGKTIEEQERLIVARNLGAQAATKQGEDAIKALKDYQDAAKESARQIEVIDSLRGGFANFFEDVLSGTRSVKDAFRDMIADIANQILRAQAQKWAEQLFGQFGSSQSGSAGGGWAGFFTAIAGAFSGAGGRAAGGWMAPNSVYRVNESGMEMATVGGRDYLLTGSRGGNVTPANQLPMGGVVNNFAFAAPTTPKTQSQVASRVGYEIRRAQRFGA